MGGRLVTGKNDPNPCNTIARPIIKLKLNDNGAVPTATAPVPIKIVLKPAIVAASSPAVAAAIPAPPTASPIGKKLVLAPKKPIEPESEPIEVVKKVPVVPQPTVVPKKLIIKGANQITVYQRLIVGYMCWVDEANTRIFSDDLSHIIGKIIAGEIVWGEDHNITLCPHV